MSFLKNIFGYKRSFAAILTSTQNKIFNIYGLVQPTDAQKMKAFFYLCIAGIAILNDMGRGRLPHSVIDKLVEETRELTKPLRMQICELSNNEEQLAKILSDFPNDLEITETTAVNGLAAFEAMYFSMGRELMNDILTHNQGDFGIEGYAAIVVAHEIFGEERAKQNWMEFWVEFNNFIDELIKTI